MALADARLEAQLLLRRVYRCAGRTVVISTRCPTSFLPGKDVLMIVKKIFSQKT